MVDPIGSGPEVKSPKWSKRGLTGGLTVSDSVAKTGFPVGNTGVVSGVLPTPVRLIAVLPAELRIAG